MSDVAGLLPLTEHMDLEQDGDQRCEPVIAGRQLDEIPITEAQMPNGRRIKLLKTLLSSACERDCYYCPFRAGRDMRRATYKPDEMAKTFLALHQSGYVEGMFLSSGVVGGGVRTQDLLLDTAEILRNKLSFKGYLHLKIMPGAERDQVVRAMHLASRISVNLEAPNTARLQKLAPAKAFTEELLQPLNWAEEVRRNQTPHKTWNGRWPSSVTQFVVGAVGESDVELLATSEQLYRKAGLTRAYYSRFTPVADTPFDHLPAESERRQHRLYQASFLLRDYGFHMEEMPFDGGGNLDQGRDPKLAWAQMHLAHNPVEVNRADKNHLLRIPGIGPKGALAILQGRRSNKICSLADLRKLGVMANRAAPFVLLNGRRATYQLGLAI
jgi:predicted DNA-binding helix-hairpin-helix protein